MVMGSVMRSADGLVLEFRMCVWEKGLVSRMYC